MNDYLDIIISFCLVIICSYFFQYLTGLLKIPSVIFLISSGIGLKLALDYFHMETFDFTLLLQVLGNIGLILIVLEGSLELGIERKKLALIGNAFLNAFFVFATTVAAISVILYYFYRVDFFSSLVYAIPLSTVSSAIAIPSAGNLEKGKKEFIVFETTFSDIIGIMVFNFCFLDSGSSLNIIGEISYSIIVTIILAFVFSFFLVYVVARSKIKINFFLILSLLILMYAIGKKFHLPSLFIVLVFGLLLKNHQMYHHYRWFAFTRSSRMTDALREMEGFTSEFAFIVRTFFFLLFGYSIDLNYFAEQDVWVTGGVILFIILVFRFLNMKMVYHEKSVFPEIFIAPRGLITILLYYSIPAQYTSEKLNPGIMYFVILASNIIMMLAILFTDRKLNYSDTEAG